MAEKDFSKFVSNIENKKVDIFKMDNPKPLETFTKDLNDALPKTEKKTLPVLPKIKKKVNSIEDIKEECKKDVIEILKEITYTKPGSIIYLMHGKIPSVQSINIKMGKIGEFIAKELIGLNGTLELLKCGVQKVDNKQKDIDLIWKDGKTIYYRELKGNIDLDTEKLIATKNKCNKITLSLKKIHVDCTVNYGILNWSVYNRSEYTDSNYLNKINKFETAGVTINHFEDFLKIICIEWPKEDFYAFFKELGSIN
jgi:hypothetical protein